MSQYFIGLSTSGHDPSIAVVNDAGEVIFAESTERYLQDKRAWGALPDQVMHLAPVFAQIIKEDPEARFQMASSWAKDKTQSFIGSDNTFISESVNEWMRNIHHEVQSFAGRNLKFILNERLNIDIWRYEHHLCHAVNAVYSSPFSTAACLVLDGEGDVGAASLYHFNQGQLTRVWRSWGPGSLGTFYAWATGLCGFTATAGEEWKVMGLAAYGKARETWVERLCGLMNVVEGRIEWADKSVIDATLAYFASAVPNPHLKHPDVPDLAASAQAAFSYYAQQIIQDVYTSLPEKRLIYTGGCALNSSFNGTITTQTSFEQVHVPSAPGDDGNAIGAALLAWQQYMTQHRSNTKKDAMQPQDTVDLPYGFTLPYLGSKPSKAEVSKLHAFQSPLHITKVKHSGATEVAALLAKGKIVGVMRGAAEMGPRALGHRSILANPCIADMKDTINRLVKGRENYRPFAPVVPETELANWFVNPQPSPYMSFTLRFREDKETLVPAVVHADGTGRVQSVSTNNAPWLHECVWAFAQHTQIPVLLNTSFNVMGKPIVHSVNDAVGMLLSTGLDAVLISDVLIAKCELPC